VYEVQILSNEIFLLGKLFDSDPGSQNDDVNIFGLDGVWKHAEGFRIRTGS